MQIKRLRLDRKETHIWIDAFVEDIFVLLLKCLFDVLFSSSLVVFVVHLLVE